MCGSRKCLALAVKANKLGRALRCDMPGSLILELESHVVEVQWDRAMAMRKSNES